MSPWLAEAKRRNPKGASAYADCGACMRTTPLDARRALACAYEPPVEGARGYEPPGYDGGPLVTCPGYTTKLPEVIEALEARFFLNKSSLHLIVDGELTEAMRDALLVLEGAEGDVLRWSLANPEKK